MARTQGSKLFFEATEVMQGGSKGKSKISTLDLHYFISQQIIHFQLVQLVIMRIFFISSLFGYFIFLIACTGNRQGIGKNSKDSIIVETTDISSGPDDDSSNADIGMADTAQSGTYDKSYTEKSLHPAVYNLNDTSEVVYFEDSIHGNFCSLYIKSVIDVVDSTRRPGNSLSLFKNKDEKAVLVVNASNVKLASKITDSDLMLPTRLGIFRRSDRTFLLIKMNLVSNMGGDYWYNLLLGLDTTGHVISQKGIETTGEIPFSQVIQGVK